jgi:hypothetical protein
MLLLFLAWQSQLASAGHSVHKPVSRARKTLSKRYSAQGIMTVQGPLADIRANIVGMLSILVCHLPKSAKHVRIVEFAYLEIASAAVRDRTSMAKYLPKGLRTLYRSGWTRANNGFTRSDSAINEIEGQRPERNDFCHRPPILR